MSDEPCGTRNAPTYTRSDFWIRGALEAVDEPVSVVLVVVGDVVVEVLVVVEDVDGDVAVLAVVVEVGVVDVGVVDVDDNAVVLDVAGEVLVAVLVVVGDVAAVETDVEGAVAVVVVVVVDLVDVVELVEVERFCTNSRTHRSYSQGFSAATESLNVPESSAAFSTDLSTADRESTLSEAEPSLASLLPPQPARTRTAAAKAEAAMLRGR